MQGFSFSAPHGCLDQGLGMKGTVGAVDLKHVFRSKKVLVFGVFFSWMAAWLYVSIVRAVAFLSALTK